MANKINPIAVESWRWVLKVNALLHGNIQIVDREKRYSNVANIESCLRTLMEDTGAQRAWVISYWNGKNNEYIGYKPYGVWYADFEVARSPLQILGHAYQNVPCEYMHEEFENVKEYGFSEIINVDLDYNGYSGNLHKARGLRAYHGRGIFKYGQLIGGIGVDWVDAFEISDRERNLVQEVGEYIKEQILDKRCKTCLEFYTPDGGEHVCKICEAENGEL